MRSVRAIVLIVLAALFGSSSAAFAQIGLRGKPQPVKEVIPEAFTGDAIADAIKIVSTFGGAVVIPPGAYIVTRTINLERISPMTITGTSAGGLDGNAGVRLVWRGPSGQPMIKISGHHVQWRNILFDGQDQASVGILGCYSPGWASSFNVYEDCVFARFTGACVQMAIEQKEGNNDFNTFVRCNFQHSGAGFIDNADQSVIHRFDNCEFGSLKTGIDVRFGGAINVTGGACSWTDLFIRIAKSGHNGGGVNIVGVKVEAEGYTRKYLQLLTTNKGESDGVQVTFDQIRMTNAFNKDKPDSETPLFDIGPRASVTVRDSFLKQNGDWPLFRVLGSSEDGDAVLHIENSMLWGDLNKIKFNEFSRIRIIDPMDSSAKRGPSFIRENVKP